MVKREHTAIDLTAAEDCGDPVAQRARLEEPDHLLCPITSAMFRYPVVLMESGRTYERAAIEEHLRRSGTDPFTRVRIVRAPVTNLSMRNAVVTWLEQNPGITPDGWDSRELVAPSHPQHDVQTLHVCAQNGHLEVARALIEAGADLDAANEVGSTPLHMCAETGHLEVAQALIEAGADVNAKANNGCTPLHLSAQHGHLTVARALIEKGADLNSRKVAPLGRGLRALRQLFRAIQVVRARVPQRADVGEDGATPLYICARYGHPEVARALIDAGADLNAKTSGGFTPVYVCAQNGHLEVARALIQAGVDLNGKMSYEPLLICAIKGHLAVARALIEAGADVNTANAAKHTALHWSAVYGHLEVVRALIEAGADVNAKTNNGNTPLHLSALNGQLEVARALIKAGSNFVGLSRRQVSDLLRKVA